MTGFRPAVLFLCAALSFLTAATALSLLAAVAARADPRFALPADCTPYTDCWPVKYVDQDPSPAWKDYRCGWHAADGHRGFDLAIADTAAMRAGVPVLAAAAGRVMRTRDGMEDTGIFGRGGKRAVSVSTCGNGVSLDHGGGWTTKYCHLRKGSIRVRPGDKVAEGQPLGLVGLSGMTEFPHVHFEVNRHGAVVDPFVGLAGGEPCALGKAPLWRPEVLAKLPYKPLFITTAGFAAARPNTDTVRAGLYNEKALPRRAPVLLMWIDLHWATKGDHLEIVITGPDGSEVLRYGNDLERTTVRWVYFAGARRQGLFWPRGTYRGTARVTRATGPGGPADYQVSAEILVR